jgi:hypothetical protein
VQQQLFALPKQAAADCATAAALAAIGYPAKAALPQALKGCGNELQRPQIVLALNAAKGVCTIIQREHADLHAKQTPLKQLTKIEAESRSQWSFMVTNISKRDKTAAAMQTHPAVSDKAM